MQSYSSIACAVLGVLLSLAPVPLGAQAATRPWRLWVAAGLGAGGNNAEGGIAAMAGVAFQRAPHQLAIEVTRRADRHWQFAGEELTLLCFVGARGRLLAEAVLSTPR